MPFSTRIVGNDDEPCAPVLPDRGHAAQRKHAAVRAARGHRRRRAPRRALRGPAGARPAAAAARVLRRRRRPRRPRVAGPHRARRPRDARRLPPALRVRPARGHDAQRRLRHQGDVELPARPPARPAGAPAVRRPAGRRGAGGRLPGPAPRPGAAARQGRAGRLPVDGGPDRAVARRGPRGPTSRARVLVPRDRPSRRAGHRRRARLDAVVRRRRDRTDHGRLRGARAGPAARRPRGPPRAGPGAGRRAAGAHAPTGQRALAGVGGPLSRRSGGGGSVTIAQQTGELRLSHLAELEAEAVTTMREVAAELERPVLLFSGGKDSIVLLRLAEKAFRPGRFPFPVLHVDTGHNFPEVLAFRDRRIAELGEELIVASVQDSIDAGRVVEERGPRASRNPLQTTTFLDAIEAPRFDACFGGARRDEERARAKERVISLRDDFGGWEPRRQRPELWDLYNTRVAAGEHLRVFPLSNWTELDVWQYILREGIEVPSIYLAHERTVFRRDGMLLADSEHVERMDGEEPFAEWVRYRTVGDMSCTGAVASRAATLDAVVAEIAATRITERGETRADDRASEAAMEDRKVAGYF